MKGDYAEELYIFGSNDGRESLELPLSEDEQVWSAKISPDGSRVFLNGKAPRLIDATSGRILQNFLRLPNLKLDSATRKFMVGNLLAGWKTSRTCLGKMPKMGCAQPAPD